MQSIQQFIELINKYLFGQHNVCYVKQHRMHNNCTSIKHNRPAVSEQQLCHSAAASADVVVPSPPRPTPSSASRAPSPAVLSPSDSTPSATDARSELGPCLPRSARPAGAAAGVPTRGILDAAELLCAASQSSCSASPALPASSHSDKTVTAMKTYEHQYNTSD